MSRTRLSMLCLYFTAAALSSTAVSCGPAECPGDPATPGPLLAVPSRVAARSRGDDCPDPLQVPRGAWRVEPVFSPIPGQTLPKVMRGRCVYTWAGSGAPDLRGLPIAKLRRWSEDPPHVVPQGPPTLQNLQITLRNVRDERHKEMWRQVDGVKAPPPGKEVLMGFPDTAPSNAGEDPLIPAGTVPHGFNLAWIARDLTCPNGDPCLTRPIIEPGLDKGWFGSRTGLAKAIQTILDRWDAAGSSKKLILNIASAWEPVDDCHSAFVQDHEERSEPPSGQKANADEKEDKNQPLQPEILDADGVLHAPPSPCGSGGLLVGSEDVYVALLRATCKGALVFAAAGNNPGYGNLEGPMLPAAWQRFPRPNARTCNRLFGGPPPGGYARPGALVNAVAGVDGHDLPIAVTRRGSRPRLVAPASLLVGYPDSIRDGYGGSGCGTPPCDPSAPITGTSVATTIASSAAALVWAAHPDMDPEAVVKAVYDGGQDLGTRAELCGHPPCSDNIHRVALCGAMVKAAQTQNALVPSLSCSPPQNPPPPSDITPFLLHSNVLFTGSTAGNEVSGQPVFPCPDCVVFRGKDEPPSYPAEVQGFIDSQFMPSAEEPKIHGYGVTLYDERGGIIPPSQVSVTWTPGDWIAQTTNLGVDIKITSDQVRLGSAYVTWSGDSGRLYTQEVPIASTSP